MNTQWTSRVRLCVLAAAGIALAGVSTPAHAGSPLDTRPVTALNGWNVKMGPGLGSVKTPFLTIQVGTSAGDISDNTIYFHTSTEQPVQQVPAFRMGPGPWSIRSPFNSMYITNTF